MNAHWVLLWHFIVLSKSNCLGYQMGGYILLLSFSGFLCLQLFLLTEKFLDFKCSSSYALSICIDWSCSVGLLPNISQVPRVCLVLGIVWPITISLEIYYNEKNLKGFENCVNLIMQSSYNDAQSMFLKFREISPAIFAKELWPNVI